MAGCRDCSVCTESCVVRLVKLPFRVAWTLLTFWNIGLFRRHCPQCRHLMSRYRMIGGRFID
jgi:hypothetical protein